MSKITTFLLPAVALFGLIVCVGISRGQDKPEVGSLAHFRFNGDAKDANKGNPDFELKNTSFIDNALYLNGVYELGKAAEHGYHAVCTTPTLDYNKFTVAIRFKTEDIRQRKNKETTNWNNLFTGGTSHRWFCMSKAPAGKLAIGLNNDEFSYKIKDATIDRGKWTVVACGVDLPDRKVVVYLNGKLAAAIDLPKDFELKVVETERKDGDKVWSFANYSNGAVFHGLVDELIIYGKMLSAEEFAKIPLRP